jgi:ComF family protein
MVHALKYQGWEAAAAPMAARLAELVMPADVMEEARITVPVPVTASRLRERGYNQAALLAAAFAERTSRTCEPRLLVRSHASDTQTTLHPDERRANVAGAFAPAPGADSIVRGEHILLIDDVWTTGATALACSAALFGAGARVVSVLTFARALPNLDTRLPGGAS